MIALDEEAFICDMAETYQIYDYKRVPGRKLGILAAGLRDDSRIKMKINGAKTSTENIMLAYILDGVNFLCWTKTKDAQHNHNRPKSVVDELYEKPSPENGHALSVSDIEAFKRARDNILKNEE